MKTKTNFLIALENMAVPNCDCDKSQYVLVTVTVTVLHNRKYRKWASYPHIVNVNMYYLLSN